MSKSQKHVERIGGIFKSRGSTKWRQERGGGQESYWYKVKFGCDMHMESVHKISNSALFEFPGAFCYFLLFHRGDFVISGQSKLRVGWYSIVRSNSCSWKSSLASKLSARGLHSGGKLLSWWSDRFVGVAGVYLVTVVQLPSSNSPQGLRAHDLRSKDANAGISPDKIV
jgi:hypothetical protein